jgi:hypothetical protein
MRLGAETFSRITKTLLLLRTLQTAATCDKILQSEMHQTDSYIRVVQSSHLLATYHVTYFTTYLIRRTRRRVISDLNSDNELR